MEEAVASAESQHCCEFCTESFPSKTKLFKHLSTHGVAVRGKATKLALLVGWISNLVEYQDRWIGEQLLGSDRIIDSVAHSVEECLFRIIAGIDSQAGLSLEEQRDADKKPKGYSRGTGTSQRVSLLFAAEPTTHSLCDTVCFSVYAQFTSEEWLSRIRACLPAHIAVHDTYLLLPGGDFHAETDCTQRRYECLLPLDLCMPVDLVGLPEVPVVRQRTHQENGSMARFSYDSSEGQRRVSFFRRLKAIFKQITGRHFYHNFVTCGAVSSDAGAARRVDRVTHSALLTINGREYALFSVTGDSLLRGQVRHILGVSLAVALGLLPEAHLSSALSSKQQVSLPTIPGWCVYLAECRYARYEGKHAANKRLDPRRVASGTEQQTEDKDSGKEKTKEDKGEGMNGMNESMRSFSQQLLHHIANLHSSNRVGSSSSWLQVMREQCSSMHARALTVQRLQLREQQQLLDEFISRYGGPPQFDQPLASVQAQQPVLLESAEVGEGVIIAEPQSLPAAKRSRRERKPSKNSIVAASTNDISSNSNGKEKEKVRDGEAFHRLSQSLPRLLLSSPAMINDCPPVYFKVLSLLRAADRSGLWPSSSTGRQAVIAEGSLVEQGGRGGSFGLGALPPPLAQPKGNALFSELLTACFELEAALCPGRIPSATIAVNRHAQFLPHRDSGAGTGQSSSLIVALGCFTGGELVVGDQAVDIRYQPLEFDGWMSIHCTMPFVGERYSLVWFSPLGTEEMSLPWRR